MSRSPNAPKGRTAVLRVLCVAASAATITLAATAPAVAQINISVQKPVPAQQPAPQRLTLETAKPLPVPPPPDLRTPKPVTAPPRLVVPKVLDAPPAPDIAVGPTPAAPPPPAGAPPPPPRTAAAPEAPKADAPPPPPARTQTAALPPSPPPDSPASKGQPLSVVFDGAAADLPESAEAAIDGLAERMRANEYLRLQLRSYASGTPDTAREARQLSLARALALRERLTAAGVRSARIDVRALGLDAGGGPPDRIDVEFLNE